MGVWIFIECWRFIQAKRINYDTFEELPKWSLQRIQTPGYGRLSGVRNNHYPHEKSFKVGSL
jgi:hypothetical protein